MQYNRNVGGEKVNEDTFRKPDNILTGAIQGFKGGAIEIATGFAGIFTKPYEGAKSSGVSGFFKGVGQGLLGAVTAPVTAVLKIGTSLVQGIEGTVVMIGKGGVSHQGRIRFPRYITPINVLVRYDESLSEAKLIMFHLYGEKYASENILLFEVLKNEKRKKEPMVIITEKRALLLNYKKEVRKAALHSNIKYAQLYLEEKINQYVLKIVLKDEKTFSMATIDYPSIFKCTEYFASNKKTRRHAPKLTT